MTEVLTNRKRRRIVEPTKVTDLKTKVIARYREVLLESTERISAALDAWTMETFLEIGPGLATRTMAELEMLAEYYRRFGYDVKASDGEAGRHLIFQPVKTEVKLDDVLQEKPAKPKKPAPKVATKK